MKIMQLLTTVSFGDAVSNDAFAINDILKKNGFQTDIYAENIDKRLADGMAKSVYLKNKDVSLQEGNDLS